MLTKYNTKGKFILFLVFTGLSGALVLGFLLYQHGSKWLVTGSSLDNVSAQRTSSPVP